MIKLYIIAGIICISSSVLGLFYNNVYLIAVAFGSSIVFSIRIAMGIHYMIFKIDMMILTRYERFKFENITEGFITMIFNAFAYVLSILYILFLFWIKKFSLFSRLIRIY